MPKAKTKPKRQPKHDTSAFALLPAEGPGSWTFTIDGWHPTKLNLLINSHHMVANRMKRADARTVAVACFLAGVTAATGKRRLTFTIVLGPRMRGGDPDAYNKSLRDSVCRCHAIVDDNRQWLAGSDAEYERGPAMATRITLEDIES